MAKTQRERDAEKREGKLAEIADQVADGRLTIRQMTPAEREKFAPRTDRPRAKSKGTR